MGIQAKKAAYRKLALAMIKEKDMEDYLLRIGQEKALLVNIILTDRTQEEERRRPHSQERPTLRCLNKEKDNFQLFKKLQ